MPPIRHGNGHIGHAELKIGDLLIMLADEFPDMNVRGPESFGGSPVSLHLYVKDVDQVARQVVAAGGTVKHPVENRILRRPDRHVHRSIRPHLACRHAC